jgi:hypothetical protein
MNLRFSSFLQICAFYLFIVFLFSPNLGFSKPVGVQPNPVPVNGTFLLPVGILFPAFPSAACVNAAALPSNESLTALQLAYSPKRGQESQNFFSGIASASKTFGVGFGYFGALGDLKTTNGGFVGLGFKSGDEQYGLTYRNKDITAGGIGDFDLSYLTMDLRQSLSYGLVLHNVNSSPQLTAALGYIPDRFFNIEFNVNTPKANQFSGGDFILVGSSNFSLSTQITLHLQLNYHTKLSKTEPVFAGNYWISDVANAILQFTSPNVWSFGFSLIF